MALRRTGSVPPSASEPATNEAVSLLTSILREVRSQVTVPPLGEAAQAAVEEFRRIRSGLALAERPNVTLEAVQNPVQSGEPATLRWTTTNARTVSIDNGIGEVTPPEAGEVITAPLTTNTTFTATARGTGACTAATSQVEVRVSGVDVGRAATR